MCVCVCVCVCVPSETTNLLCCYLSSVVVVAADPGIPSNMGQNESGGSGNCFPEEVVGPIARPANTALLYMRSSSGGLNLPSLTALYKKLHRIEVMAYIVREVEPEEYIATDSRQIVDRYRTYEHTQHDTNTQAADNH